MNAELGAEFDRYVAEHPAWAQKHVPQGAKVALQIEGECRVQCLESPAYQAHAGCGSAGSFYPYRKACAGAVTHHHGDGLKGGLKVLRGSEMLWKTRFASMG
ncbi:MAG: hypothetical protein Q8S00_05700 [Deltaproteobacteria bacterium]|nr:hypothetical protein [Deltaproteobacteria bacterium]